ncbi:9597_t:CDS:2 [Cetraspora pellucida]|uniref:9597_t:CDS:1 n=1 Tax=Cetraspora pellucida TaxID=1433469 RepID=A0ACA9LW70_9GLOM|nr:9597_t:CDS:2 [Cetraspora pellucida]
MTNDCEPVRVQAFVAPADHTRQNGLKSDNRPGQDYNLKNTTTLRTLTEAPYNFINRPCLITYEELTGRDNLPLYSDTLYDLAANLKEALELLQDKIAKGQYDEYGEPIILEEGICSLIIFADISDGSTPEYLQVIFTKAVLSKLTLGSVVKVSGKLILVPERDHQQELKVENIDYLSLGNPEFKSPFK